MNGNLNAINVSPSPGTPGNLLSNSNSNYMRKMSSSSNKNSSKLNTKNLNNIMSAFQDDDSESSQSFSIHSNSVRSLGKGKMSVLSFNKNKLTNRKSSIESVKSVKSYENSEDKDFCQLEFIKDTYLHIDENLKTLKQE